MLEDILECVGVMLIGFVVIIAVVVAIISISIPFQKYDCSKLGEQVGYSTEYHFWGSGCLLDIDGEMIPRSKWINNTGN